MKAKQIKVGGVYYAKVSGNIVKVRVDRIRDTWDTLRDRSCFRYDVTNLKTKRQITFKSVQRFRSEAIPPQPEIDFQSKSRFDRMECPFCGCFPCCCEEMFTIT